MVPNYATTYYTPLTPVKSAPTLTAPVGVADGKYAGVLQGNIITYSAPTVAAPTATATLTVGYNSPTPVNVTVEIVNGLLRVRQGSVLTHPEIPAAPSPTTKPQIISAPVLPAAPAGVADGTYSATWVGNVVTYSAPTVATPTATSTVSTLNAAPQGAVIPCWVVITKGIPKVTGAKNYKAPIMVASNDTQE